MNSEMRAIVTAVVVICGALVVAGCAGSGHHQTSGPTSPPTTCAGCSDASPTGAEIRLARTSNSLYSIFPASPGEGSCLIPAGGIAVSHLRGACQTAVRHIGKQDRRVVVSFTEAWFPESRCPPGDHCPAIIRLDYTWSFVERLPWPGGPLRTAARHQSGTALPPQFNE